MPQWIHQRAEHLLAKNPSMDKSTAFASATQQSHAKGKSPKGYGTKQGRREARAKYNQPKRKYEGTANPGKLESPKMAEALAQQLIRAGRLLPEEVIAPQIRAGEQRFAQHMASKLSPRAHAMLSETPMGRAGTPPAMMAQLAGTSDMDAQRALMGVWDNTTPVHATAKAASIDPYYFMLDALEKSAFDMSAALNGLRVAGMPALGGALGGAVAGGFGVDPLTGEVLGAALGATPALVKALRAKRTATLAVPDVPKVASLTQRPRQAQEPKTAAGLTPAQRLKQTQEVGKVEEVEPKDVANLTKFKPIGIKLAFTESEFSGGLGPYAPFISRGYSFQSSLPGNPNKYAGPDPEEEEGDPEHFPSKNEKSASIWKAAHFACSAVGAWEEKCAGGMSRQRRLTAAAIKHPERVMELLPALRRAGGRVMNRAHRIAGMDPTHPYYSTRGAKHHIEKLDALERG